MARKLKIMENEKLPLEENLNAEYRNGLCSPQVSVQPRTYVLDVSW